MVALAVDHRQAKRGVRELVLLPRFAQGIFSAALFDAVDPFFVAVGVRLGRGHHPPFVIGFKKGTLNAFAHEVDLPGADEDILPHLAIEDVNNRIDFCAFIERVIDNGIERAPVQRVRELHRIGAVGTQALDIRRKLVGGFTAIQHGHAVPQADKPVHEFMTEIARSAYHENIHNPKACRSTPLLLSSTELTVKVRLSGSDTNKALRKTINDNYQ